MLDEGVVEMMVAKGGRRSFSPCSLLEAAGNKEEEEEK